MENFSLEELSATVGFGIIRIHIFPFCWELKPSMLITGRYSENRELIEIGNGTTVFRKRKADVRITFLCFEVKYRKIVKIRDVYDLYPKGYDYRNDPDWENKFKQLENTGYFS